MINHSKEEVVTGPEGEESVRYKVIVRNIIIVNFIGNDKTLAYKYLNKNEYSGSLPKLDLTEQINKEEFTKWCEKVFSELFENRKTIK